MALQSPASISSNNKTSFNNRKQPVEDGVGTDTETPTSQNSPGLLKRFYVGLCIFFLFLNYFLAQYDKFILSYFHDNVLEDLNLRATHYAILSGYATGIVYALLALPTAFIADYTSARVWVLTVAALWWSLCVIFQGLSRNFWQILLARIGMGIGQAPVEALSVSLISDLVGWRNVFLGESCFYVGVYVGEAVSGQIATAFTVTGTSWRVAMKAIGIVGVVIAVAVRTVLREPMRQKGLLSTADEAFDGRLAARSAAGTGATRAGESKLVAARRDMQSTLLYVMRLHSFWLIVLSASFRQLSGNVFGYYMPGYLGNTYSTHPELFSRYGIIVGTVGSVTVLTGGALTSLFWHKTRLTPIYLTAIGGMISSLFVLLMIFSRDIADGSEDQGIKILYGVMCVAYITAELWLGAIYGLVASLLPPAYKTFGIGVWSTVQVLIYSTGPEIIGLALKDVDSSSDEYRKDTQIALAVIIPSGYWIAGIGFLCCVPLLRRDWKSPHIAQRAFSTRRKCGFAIFFALLCSVVITLFTLSIYYQA
ncbi:major facilitator superfamily domain-containing protein [Lineolata rhizophorae]|uniref:Major facilitator superfamily domain-containing protein n=1 Tax=Lineolata rhizophorae TaxID=578093 RepID=A0A6A6NNR9_9PEZI|nr:major facilitator superfamily domain-containing protein [Lineolata rhizophorae]